MAVEIATATSHIDLYDRLLTFLQAAGPTGPGWTLLDNDTVTLSALFMAPGLTATEQIYMGFSVHANVPADIYAIGIWMFRAYNSALDHHSQPGTTTVVYMPIWNVGMPYWFVANAQRLVVVTKVSTTYQSLHIGKFLPYGPPSEYPQPYYLGGSVGDAVTRWSTISETHRAFFDPGGWQAISLPAGIWRAVANFYENGGETSQTNTVYIWPYNGQINGGESMNRYRELRENLDGSYSVMPLVFVGTNPENDIYGEIDGVYAITGHNQASEDIINIGANNYLVFQNMHRTARYQYAALKLV